MPIELPRKGTRSTLSLNRWRLVMITHADQIPVTARRARRVGRLMCRKFHRSSPNTSTAPTAASVRTAATRAKIHGIPPSSPPPPPLGSPTGGGGGGKGPSPPAPAQTLCLPALAERPTMKMTPATASAPSAPSERESVELASVSNQPPPDARLGRSSTAACRRIASGVSTTVRPASPTMRPRPTRPGTRFHERCDGSGCVSCMRICFVQHDVGTRQQSGEASFRRASLATASRISRLAAGRRQNISSRGAGR